MGFKVKDTPERDNFEVKNSVNAENRLKQYVLDQLSAFDIKTLQIAYIYAKNNMDYGVDVTEKWDTVCRNSKNLERAYHKGYYEGYESARQTYFDKLKVGDGEVILDPTKHNFGLDSADSDSKDWTTISKLAEEGITVDDSGFKICTDEKKEPENPIYKFEIGQIIGKFDRYPNHSKFKVLDRFVINLTHPYYKIGLIDRFFNEDSQEIVPNYYQYVPESELYLKGDNTNSRSFKFNVGDIVRTKNANRGLYKISTRYCYNVRHNTYKIGPITDGYGCCTIVDEDQLELVSKSIGMK